MNHGLLHNIRSRIKDDDLCICVGDFMVRGGRSKFRDWRKQLTGSWVFVHGNHDKNNGVKPTCEYMVCQVGPKRALVTHCPWWYHMMASYIDADGNEYPTRAWQWPEIQGIVATCDFTICGHVHEKWKFKDWDGMVAINVGVDVNNYMPITDDEVLQRLAQYERSKRDGTSKRTDTGEVDGAERRNHGCEEVRRDSETDSEERSA